MPHPIPLADPAFDQFADLPHGIRLCYRSYGAPEHPAVILIAGLGLQLVSWPTALIQGLVDQGLQVITFDNRDAGRSSHMPYAPPTRWQLLTRRIPPGHYTLEDMADDVAALMDHLQLAQAHIVGMSMGGMIAQSLAALRPVRVQTLTSIFSTTGNPRVGQPALSTTWRMLVSQPATTEQESADAYVKMMQHIGNPDVPGIEAIWRLYVQQAWQRSDPLLALPGRDRQVAAIFASGNRTEQLHQVQAPTLVIHGGLDRIVHPSGGEATARAIPGAKLHILADMRHQLDASISQQVLPLLTSHMLQRHPSPDLAPAPHQVTAKTVA